jgi:GT2 family glycosyltransferase
MALQGANMALRRTTWQQVRSSVCNRSGVHEDFDLAIHIAEHGLNVRYVSELTALVAFRQAATPWWQFTSYYLHCPLTYLKHRLKRGLWLLPVANGMILAYPLLHFLSLTYQRRTKLAPTSLRVNPATFGE